MDRILPYGDRAVLVEPADPRAVLGLRESLRNLPGVELVPAARTLLVRFDPARTDLDRVSAAIRHAGSSVAAAPDGPTVTLAVRYDGADLADVARLAGLEPDEVVRRHSSGSYTVAFCGFSPGFAYLTGLADTLQLPRLDAPRTHVPAGAVAVAGEYTGVYPRPSPGGWRLLGHTDAVLWATDRDPPALLTPGTRVRFEAL